ncbi:MAG: tetratricopeptide repeat protein [Desulfuromonadales bacterium]|nr:tetratricopeptide repeat protein [Desulfuromonadales bacterium]
MKPTTPNTSEWRPLVVATLALLLTIPLAACAPPSTTDPALDSKLTRLQQQQQQQQQVLVQLQQQLEQLQQQLTLQPPVAAITETVKPPPEPTTTDEQKPESRLLAGAGEITVMTEAAGLYLEAFSALTMGRYEQAGNSFSDFLARYADHRYVNNARYWLAETEIARGLQQQALNNLLLVANDSGQTGKAPAALARLAEIYQQQNMQQQAETILHQLRTRFPQSREAQLFNRSDQAQ